MNKVKEHILKRIADKDPELIIVTTTNGCTFIYEREMLLSNKNIEIYNQTQANVFKDGDAN